MPLTCRCSAYIGIMLIAAMSSPLRAQIGPCTKSLFHLLPDGPPQAKVWCIDDLDSGAVLHPTEIPVYPEMLLNAHVEGSVLVRFVVTAQGRIDTTTIEVLNSTHGLFSRSARNAVAHWTAHPARLRGKAVAEWNQVEIDFPPSCSKSDRNPKSIVSGGWITVCPKAPAPRSAVQRPRNQRATLP